MKDGHIWLLPANDSFAPFNGDDCQVLGVVMTVLRSVRSISLPDGMVKLFRWRVKNLL
jgi:hypothetical protein